MLRKLLLPALAIATLAGCATGYSYRGGSGDYYYGQPSVDYRYYGGYGFGGSIGYGYGEGYYLDVFGRPVYGYPYGYYGGRYPSYPYGHGPRPRPPHGSGHGGGHDGDHHDAPPGQGGHRPGNRPPWRDIGRPRDRNDDPRESHQWVGRPRTQPRLQQPAPRVRQPSPVMREGRESRPPTGRVRASGLGERPRVRSSRPAAAD
ncbi:MAG: hypothetical protein EOO27_42220 [Comamonadaceae bacterium]|nr:MAG: hypothetical protein EOO27_42220 [Comamonadaceae bacterium]